MQPNNEAFDCLFINISYSLSLFIFKQKLIFQHVSKTFIDFFIKQHFDVLNNGPLSGNPSLLILDEGPLLKTSKSCLSPR